MYRCVSMINDDSLYLQYVHTCENKICEEKTHNIGPLLTSQGIREGSGSPKDATKSTDLTSEADSIDGRASGQWKVKKNTLMYVHI
jgi:hypothetical protein